MPHDAHHIPTADAEPPHERRFHGGPDRLRAPDRVARLEVPRVVALCLDGINATAVLDVGTGTGIFAEAFAAQNLAVTGIDVNTDLLAVARQTVPLAQFEPAPMEKIPFADRSFDLVFLGHVLHEADDPLAALTEAHRLARQRVAILEWPYLSEEKGPPLEHRVKPDMVREWAAQAGFYHAEIMQLEHMAFYRLTP